MHEICITPGFWNDGNGRNYSNSINIEGKNRYPSYQSVGIFFSQKPTEEQIAVIKERSENFFDKYNKISKKSTNVISFRLLTTSTQEEYL
jgi:hypothetical protein